MHRAWNAIQRFARAETGQDLIEYAMLGALIAVVAVTAVTALGQQITNVLWAPIVNNF